MTCFQALHRLFPTRALCHARRPIRFVLFFLMPHPPILPESAELPHARLMCREHDSRSCPCCVAGCLYFLFDFLRRLRFFLVQGRSTPSRRHYSFRAAPLEAHPVAAKACPVAVDALTSAWPLRLPRGTHFRRRALGQLALAQCLAEDRAAVLMGLAVEGPGNENDARHSSRGVTYGVWQLGARSEID